MSWISKTDLLSKINAGELDAITEGDDTIINHCISVAVALVKSFLAKQFNTETIFAAEGSERDPLLLTFCIDISIYEIVALCQAGQDVADRKARKDDAIDWLKQVRSGKIIPDLPLLTDDSGNEYPRLSGGNANPARKTYY